MIRVLRLLLALYVAIVLQTLLAPSLEILGVRPDFPFLVVLLVAFYEGAAGGALGGFVAGLFVDLNSAQALGITSLANSVVAFGVGSVVDRLIRGSMLTRFLVALVATVLRDQILVFFGDPGGLSGSFRLFLHSSLPGGIYTALLAPPVMALVERVVGWEREMVRGLR